jgi:hypothetical protein
LFIYEGRANKIVTSQWERDREREREVFYWRRSQQLGIYSYSILINGLLYCTCLRTIVTFIIVLTCLWAIGLYYCVTYLWTIARRITVLLSLDYCTKYYRVTCLWLVILYMNSAVDRDQGLDWSTLRILVPVCFFGWSRQLPYKAVSLLLDISEVITRERYQLYRTELVDIINAVCSFQIFTLFFFSS